jgi:formate--tetrahydrofolate ligase
VKNFCEGKDCDFAISNVWEKGGEGGIDLANLLLSTLENKESKFKVLYPNEFSIQDKIKTVSKEIYGASDVAFSSLIFKKIKKLEDLGYDKLPICMAKTQYSLSDDPSLLGRPTDFTINVRDVYVSAGAGFIVVLTGTVMTMPGLPKKPAAYDIDVNEKGKIVGLF